ncbi:MAG: PilZ domain-containing protein [Magnetococcales bacterium]|nr:PilZ domain-containing protein [Magnetococcales bacterium]
MTTPPQRRRHWRVPFDGNGRLVLQGRGELVGRCIDISRSGLLLGSLEADLVGHEGWPGELHLQLPSQGQLHDLALPVRVQRALEKAVGLRFLDMDRLIFDRLDGFLKERLATTNGSSEADMEQYEMQIRMLREELPEHLPKACQEMFAAFMEQSVRAVSVQEQTEYQDYVPPAAELIATVHFRGELEGGLHVASPLHVGLRIAEAFGGEQYGTVDDYNPEALDAFGEVSNILAGLLTQNLAHLFPGIHLTPPTVTVGQAGGTLYSARMHSVKVFFHSSMGPFLTECYFMP